MLQASDIRIDTQRVSIDNLLARTPLSTSVAIEGRAAGRRLNNHTFECTNLIESILVRIPLPEIVVSRKANNPKWGLVTRARLVYALEDYMVNNTYVLQGLVFFPDLEGLGFNDLPRNYQRRLLETNLTLQIIELSRNECAIFEALNRINIMNGF